MEYRKIGKTGMKASVVGLGPEHLVGKPFKTVDEVVGSALDHGVNIMDLFMPQEDIRRDIGRALGSRRKDVFIQGHIGSTLKDGQFEICRDLDKSREHFEHLMRTLGTDYIDVGMLFFVDGDEAFDKMFNSEITEYALKLKRDGVIRAIGASSHNAETSMKIVQSGIVDVLMFSINPLFDLMPGGYGVEKLFPESYSAVEFDSARLDLYRMCEREGVAITVMKTLGSGILLGDRTPFVKPMTVPQCIHYVLERPAVVSALVGCTTAEQVLDAVKYCDTSPVDRDYSEIVRTFSSGFKGACMYCNHCQPCPSAIDIAAVHKYLDIARLDLANVPDTIRGHYAELKAHGSDCIGCGDCETRCPFGVPITDDMAKAVDIFGL